MDASDAAVTTDTFQPTDIVTPSDVALDIPNTMDADSGSTQDDASREASTTDASDVVASPDVNIIGMCPAAMPVMGAMGVAAPRLIYPLSGSVVSNARPTVQYRLPAGVTGGRVEFCSTRDCDTLLAAFESDSDRVRPKIGRAHV